MLFEKIAHWENLLLAAYKAAKGKRGKASTADFLFLQEPELLALQRELTTKTWRPGAPYHRLVRKEKVRRYRRFLKQKIRQYHRWEISPDELENALNAWLGHIRFGQSRRLEYQVFWQLQRAGIPVFKHPDGAWKVLEYRP